MVSELLSTCSNEIKDKLILFCYSHGIKPVLVVNKQDLSCELNNYVLSNYSTFIETLFVSAKTSENLALLTSVLKGRLSAFAGQSAVGKSALINSLFQDKNAIEGELSKKINRGKRNGNRRNKRISRKQKIY